MVRVLVLARDNIYAERAIMLAPVRLSVRHGVDQLKTIEAMIMIMQLLLFSRFMRLISKTVGDTSTATIND